jgi:ABC-type multidrug transport system fused ATPase/permease subunit
MDFMANWIRDLSVINLVLLIIGVLVVLAIISALLARVLVRVGLRTPFVLHLINRGRERVIELVKRPITIMVLDEVADVIQTGHYTRNIAAALQENHDELKALVAEKIRHDPSTRLIGRLPLYDAVVSQTSETTLRVIIEMLGDPRMDELVSDLLRNNLQQIKRAVRERQNEKVPPHTPPDLVVQPRIAGRP